MSEKITWAPHIPLIGGFPLGAEKAIGHAPEEIFSLPGFLGNDKHYINYQNNILKRDLAYTPLDPEDMAFDRKINIIVGTPPCAALSQLNTGKSAESKGAGCQKNAFMYIVFEHGMRKYNADVIIVENAPALFTTKGEGVAEKLYDLCKANGYSMTLYKTTTSLHGIPQNRDRTFAFAWKSETAPILNWYDKPRRTFAEHLSEVNPESDMGNVVINEKLLQCGYYQYITDVLKEDPRKVLPEANQITTFNYLNKKGLIPAVVEWFREMGMEKPLKLGEHALKKFADNKGIWDGSVHVFNETMNAVIGRNMADTVHPTESRSLTYREAMHMMGLPHDFVLVDGKKNGNHIAQNVPTCTAADMVREAVKFINGELKESGHRFVKQNNHNKKTWSFDELNPAPSLNDLL